MLRPLCCAVLLRCSLPAVQYDVVEGGACSRDPNARRGVRLCRAGLVRLAAWPRLASVFVVRLPGCLPRCPRSPYSQSRTLLGVLRSARSVRAVRAISEQQ